MNKKSIAFLLLAGTSILLMNKQPNLLSELEKRQLETWLIRPDSKILLGERRHRRFLVLQALSRGDRVFEIHKRTGMTPPAIRKVREKYEKPGNLAQDFCRAKAAFKKPRERGRPGTRTASEFLKALKIGDEPVVDLASLVLHERAKMAIFAIRCADGGGGRRNSRRAKLLGALRAAFDHPEEFPEQDRDLEAETSVGRMRDFARKAKPRHGHRRLSGGSKAMKDSGDARSIVAKITGFGEKRVDQCLAITKEIDRLLSKKADSAAAELRGLLNKSFNTAYKSIAKKVDAKKKAPAGGREGEGPEKDALASKQILIRLKYVLAQETEGWPLEKLASLEDEFPNLLRNYSPVEREPIAEESGQEGEDASVTDGDSVGSGDEQTAA